MTVAASPRPSPGSSGGFNATALSILIGASVMLSLSMGMRQSLGLFMGDITRGVGITVAEFTFAIAVQNILWGITQPMVGAIVDRFGCRPVTIAGTILYAAGLGLPIVLPGNLGVMLGLGVLLGVALSCTAAAVAMSASARAVSPARRSLVFGIISGAGSVGAFVAAPLAQNLLVSDGWQIALIAFIGLAAAMLPAAFFAGGADRMPRPPAATSAEAANLKAAVGEAFGHGGYVTMALAFFVCGLQLVFITTHMPTYLADCGFDPMLSAKMLAAVGFFNIIGSFLFGWLGGLYPKQILLGMAYLLRSAFIAAYFMLPVSEFSTLLFAAAMGLLWLGVIPLVNGLVADIFGVRFMATLTGIAFFFHQVGSFIGAWGGGLIYQSLGSYDLAWKAAVAIGLTAGVCQMLMSVRPTARLAAASA
jgi:MFS family permease